MVDAKILYIIGQLVRGGAEQQLYFLLKNLRPRATILSLSQNGYWGNPIRKLSYEVIELKRISHFDITRLWAVAKYIRTLEPDIIHIFMDGVSGIYGRLAALINQHPCVIVGERRHPSADPAWYSLIKRFWLNRYVSAIVANARSSRHYLIVHDKLPPHKARFIPNGLELDRFAPEKSPNQRSLLPKAWRHKITVGTVGSLHPRKSPETYVRVARRVLDLYPDVRFLHVGDGPLGREVETLSRDLLIQERIRFFGFRHNIAELLREMDIFVLTSRHEGTPNAAMEAMATGLPCIVTDTGGCRELVRDRETGFVVPVGDENELANRVLLLLRDAALRRGMGLKGQERVREFDIRPMVEQYRLLYHDLQSKR